MCGMIGWCSKSAKVEPEVVYEYVANQYEEQHSRGSKGFGVLAILDNGHIKIRRATEPVKMFFDLYLAKTRHLFLHHRMPTSTENFLSQTHPFTVEHDELKYHWQIMHNGVISNSKILKEIHEKLGYVYETEHEMYNHGSSGSTTTKFNDSESFAIELVRFLEGKSVHLASKGTQAFIAFRLDKKTSKIDAVIMGRNGGNPLKVLENERGFMMASEEPDGTQVGENTALCLQAKYTSKGTLKGFELAPVTIPLFFEPIVSTYYPQHHSTASADTREYYESVRDHIPGDGHDVPQVPGRNAWSPSHMNSVHSRTAGFHADQEAWRDNSTNIADKRPAKPPKKEDGVFETYKECIEYFEKSPLGEILRAKATLKNEFVDLFPWTLIRNNLIVGLIESAEDAWTAYLDEILDLVDLNDMMSHAIDSNTSVKPGSSLEEIVKVYQQSPNTRMGIVAQTLVPFFKIHALMDVLMRGTYAIKIRENKETMNSFWPNDAELTKPEAIRLEEEADQLLLESARASIEPGLAINVSDTIRVETVPDVAVMLAILEDSASSMDPDSVLREAEIIGDAIRGDAEQAIAEQLSEMQVRAAEQGEVLALPFHENKMRDIQISMSNRFTRLAKVVAIAHERDEYIYGSERNGPEYDGD